MATEYTARARWFDVNLRIVKYGDTWGHTRFVAQCRPVWWPFWKRLGRYADDGIFTEYESCERYITAFVIRKKRQELAVERVWNKQDQELIIAERVLSGSEHE